MLTFSARWKLIISFSSCFAGGVFIAACLLDLLPDVEEKIDQVSIFFCCWLFIRPPDVFTDMRRKGNIKNLSQVKGGAFD
jgi:hypothetical protein